MVAEKKATVHNTEYNGYKNRATWNVVLWLLNTEGHYHATKNESAKIIRNYCKKAWGSKTPDDIEMAYVYWNDVAEACKEEPRELDPIGLGFSEDEE